jgi:hypothetical protein
MEGVVDDETLVFVEGAEDWERLKDASAMLGFGEEGEEDEDDAIVDEDEYAVVEHADAGAEQGEEEVFYSVGGGAAIGVPGASRLAAMIADGSLDPGEAVVWKEGMDDWVDVRDFLGVGPEEG